MEVETLYTVLSEREEGGCRFFTVALDPAHDIYRGHFPGMPVTPGVCSLHMIRACAGMALGRELRYDSIGECKFLSSIVPERHGTVEVCVCAVPDGDSVYRAECSVQADGETMLKLKAHFIAA